MTDTHVQERDLVLGDLAVRTRVLEAGAGPVVLLLHGNPDNADEWRPLMQRLAATHRCIAPDFPGYGRSPEPPRSFDYGLEVQKRFVDAVLREVGAADPLTLVVHDTGGMVGTAWAAANVARVRGVVFTNTVAFEDFPWFPIARRWADATLLGRWRASLGMWALSLSDGKLFRKIFWAQSPQLTREQIDRFVASFALSAKAKRTTLRQFRQCVPPAFFRGFEALRLGLTAKVPCRVLWGDGDPYLSTDLVRRFGSAKVTVLPGVGHWVPIVAAEQLAAEVRMLTPA